MSASSNPSGIKPKYSQVGPVRPQAYQYGIASGYASSLYKYQPVTMNTSGNLVQATTAQDIMGVFAGWEGLDPTGRWFTSNNWLANQTYQTGEFMYAYIFQDPSIVYAIQADGSVAQTAIGDQADFTNITSGSSTTGLSSCTMNHTLAGASSQGQLRIIELDLSANNAWGDAFTVVHVQIARLQYVANKVAF